MESNRSAQGVLLCELGEVLVRGEGKKRHEIKTVS